MITEKELIGKLDQLKKIKPDNNWREKNRELLFNQISGGQTKLRKNFNWFGLPDLILSTRAFTNSYWPALVPTFILLILFGSGLASLQVAKNSKPGDSLYLAKLFGEKTQLAFTLNNKEKAKLGIEFAANRAKELSAVLSEPAAPDGQAAKSAQVAELVDNFKQELSAVKTRIAKIDTTANNSVAGQATTPAKNNEAATTSSDAESDFFSANLNKDTTGLEYAEGSSSKPGENTKPAGAATTTGETTTASSTDKTAPLAAVPTDPEKILEQAKDLLSNDDYSASLNKIDEANQAISDVGSGSGEVKGASENASSSVDIVPVDNASSTTGK